MKFKTSKCIYCLIFLFVIFVSFLSFKLYELSKVNHNVENEMELCRINQQLVESYLYDNIELFKIEGLSPNKEYVHTLDNVRCQFSEISSQNNNAYIYISSSNCKSCVDYMLSKLSMVNDSLGESNVTILCHNYSPRQLYVYKTQNHVNNDMFIVEDSGLFARSFDVMSKPVIFLMNEQGLISKAYSPSDDFEHLFNNYLHTIKATRKSP